MLSNLHSNTPKKARKRLGRGIGSGLGKTAGKGHKGQNARSGGGVRPGFEGGQIPLFQRLPKRGFNNPNKIYYQIVKVSDLNKFKDGQTVTSVELREKGLIRHLEDQVKLLAHGELTKKLTIKVNKASEAAKKLVTKSGSTLEVI